MKNNSKSTNQGNHLLVVKNGDTSAPLLLENQIETKLECRKWLPTQQAAEYLGTTPGGIRNRVYRDQLKVYKPFGQKGRSYFMREQLDQLLEASLL